MKHRRILLAFWLAIQLLAAQQLALAHMIGHLRENLHDHAVELHLAADDGDERHGAAHTLSHVCTTCVSCLGFDAMAAGGASADFAAVAWVRGSVIAVPPAPTLRQPVPFRSRAPPSLQG